MLEPCDEKIFLDHWIKKKIKVCRDERKISIWTPDLRPGCGPNHFVLKGIEHAPSLVNHGAGWTEYKRTGTDYSTGVMDVAKGDFKGCASALVGLSAQTAFYFKVDLHLGRGHAIPVPFDLPPIVFFVVVNFL